MAERAELLLVDRRDFAVGGAAAALLPALLGAGPAAAHGPVLSAEFEAALKAVNGKAENRDALEAALRKTDVQTCRGPVRFDQYGNVVGDVYIRQVQRKDGRLVNAVVKTYPNVSQFWKYDPKKFLAEPVYSRDWPPAKNLES